MINLSAFAKPYLVIILKPILLSWVKQIRSCLRFLIVRPLKISIDADDLKIIGKDFPPHIVKTPPYFNPDVFDFKNEGWHAVCSDF